MQQISPLQAIVQQLTDFSDFLLSSCKLPPSTTKSYRLTISTVFHLQGDRNPGSDPIVFFIILRAFSMKRPRSQKIVPQWNLALGLQAFLEEPFEPLNVCAKKFATWKTIFLVALASACLLPSCPLS